MKKSILIVAAALSLVACTKNSADVTSTQELVFSPNALTTKALILPDGNAPTETAFPTTEAFNVFAYADLTSSGTPDYASPLMNDVEISYQGGDWKATTGTYLWPNAGTVDFYAYYPGSLTAALDLTVSPKVLNFTGINLGNAIGNQIDPLVAYTLGQIATAKPKVGLVFKHITSQIAVTAVDATATTALQGKISIERVEFKNMKTTGDYLDGTTAGKGAWSNIGTLADFVSFSGSEVLTTTESYLSGGSFVGAIDNSAAFVIVPDNVVTGTAADQVVEVTYSVAAYTINGFDYPATTSQTVSIPLYNRVSGNKFQNGKRYVFHLGLSLDGANNEIMFSPTVLGWDTEDISGITVDVVNNSLL